MVRKAFGLMTEAEARKLLDAYDVSIFLGTYSPDVALENNRSKELTIGGIGPKDIMNYTITPLDYNSLISFAENLRGKKPSLLIPVIYANNFDLDNYIILIPTVSPSGILSKYNLKTKRGRLPQRKAVTQAEFTSRRFKPEHYNYDLVNSILDNVLENTILELKENNFPTEHLSVSNYMEESDDMFSIRYNVQAAVENKKQIDNIYFPETFYEGFDLYFDKESQKRIMKKIRSLINRSGSRQKPEHYRQDLIVSVPMDYITDWDNTLGKTFANRVVTKLKEYSTYILPDPARQGLSEEVLMNINRNILSAMHNYFETKGFTRPLNIYRITSKVISREVTSLIRTAVTSSLPGFQTSSGKHRGYDFNKSFEVNPGTPLAIIEAVLYKNPNLIKSMGIKLGNFNMGQILTKPVKDLLLQTLKSPPSSFINFSNAKFEVIGLNKTDKCFIMVYKYGKTGIDLLLFYNTLHDYIDNMGEGKTIEDALVESDCLKLHADNISEVLSRSILTQSAKFQPHLRERSSRRQGNKINVALEFKDALDLPSAVTGPNTSESGKLLIDFYFEADIEYSGVGYVKSLSLEKAVGSIYRLRNANRIFEIDINAQYDFSVEIRKVLNRIQNPRNFLSSDRPNINPQEKAQSFIQSIVRQIKPDTLIEIESPKYDALTGATRGIWLIVTEGIGINYFSIDDRKTGIISSTSNEQMKGSACMGGMELVYVKDEKPDNRNFYEYKDNVYFINAEGSDCINFMFPDQATESDVADGNAKKVGQLIQRKFTEKLRGYNIDPLGTVAVGALTSGRRLGEGPPKSLARLREVHMPVHNTSADLFRYGIEFVPKENIIRRGDGSMLELDDVTPLFRFFTTGYKNKEIKQKLKDIFEQSILGGKERITFIFDELNIKIKDDSKAEITRAGEAMQYSNIYPSLFAAISVYLSDEASSKVTVLEDVKDIVKQFKDVIREKILKATLGADYSGDVESDYDEYMTDTLNQTRRRGGRR